MKMLQRTKLAASVMLVAGILLFVGCGQNLKDQSATQTKLVMSTVMTVTLYGENAQAGISAAFAKAQELEQILSAQNENSELYQLNRTAYQQAVSVSQTLFTVVQQSLQYCRKTNGALDCTIGAINALWGFGTNSARVPAQEEIAPLLTERGYEQVELNEEMRTIRFLNPNISLDFGSTAKGYAADVIKTMLEEDYQITCGLINLGGNIFTIGRKYDGKPWEIGIANPQAPSQAITSVGLINATAVTSGNYERYFDRDGVRYHHILNPQTGYPVENGLASVTIFSHNSMQADALSTACYVMGVQQAMAYIEAQPEVEAIFIAQDGMITQTSGIINRTFGEVI